ncbi:MAG TPA: hypothetical protein VM146_13375 [Steroidobacteraceae bacterium]|nr:hypothetical protein [Steroidobacteraceae bacterium]
MGRLVPLLLLLTACSATPHHPTVELLKAKPGEEFTLALEGDPVSIEGTPYLLTFTRVIEDSRCASDVTCVWAGNARINIFVSDFSQTDNWPPGSNSVEIGGFIATLNTSPRFPTEGGDGHLMLELRRLAPEPKSGEQTRGYAVTLVATLK